MGNSNGVVEVAAVGFIYCGDGMCIVAAASMLMLWQWGWGQCCDGDDVIKVVAVAVTTVVMVTCACDRHCSAVALCLTKGGVLWWYFSILSHALVVGGIGGGGDTVW